MLSRVIYNILDAVSRERHGGEPVVCRWRCDVFIIGFSRWQL